MQDSSSGPVRLSQRVSATIPLSLLLVAVDSRTGHDAYTVDISAKGARVRTTFRLMVGQLIGIVPSGDFGQAIRSRVVWVDRSSDVGSLAGLEFLDSGQA